MCPVDGSLCLLASSLSIEVARAWRVVRPDKKNTKLKSAIPLYSA